MAIVSKSCRAPFAEQMPDALGWTTSDVFVRVHNDYLNRVTYALEEAVWLVKADRPQLGKRLATKLELASDEALMRVLLAPETTKRLLWRDAFPIAAVGEFLCQSLTAEAVRGGLRQQVDQSAWTALGDCMVMQSGDVSASDPIEGVLPVDLDSPNASAELLGATEGTVSWKTLERQKREPVLRDLGLAYRGIIASSPVFDTFLPKFARVIVLRRDDHPQFCSFSSRYHVGRITLINPHLIDEVLQAEALVHEAVHSLLFMQDQRPFWGLQWTGGEEPGNALSPWTGRPLPVSTFLQACFVWYGLFTFWGHASCAESFPSSNIRARVARSASGFLRGSLLNNLEDRDIAMLDTDVANAITDMQHRVSALLEA